VARHAAFGYPDRPSSPPPRVLAPRATRDHLPNGNLRVPAPLFDITTIDLNAVALSTAQVEGINPHRGHMRQLDHVIWFDHDYSSILGVKHVRDDEFWVAGHIPGRPLLPGVLMIEAGAQLCSVQYKLKTGEKRFMAFLRCDDVVFRGQVVPGDTLYLLGSEVEFRAKRLIATCQGMVDNKIVFEGRITGIVL
jgi:3-hydroxyacyl-[acyl-carrier-protein] dehydratase